MATLLPHRSSAGNEMCRLNNKNNKIGKAHRSNMISQPIFASFTLVQHSTQRKFKEILRIDKKANHNLEPRTSN